MNKYHPVIDKNIEQIRKDLETLTINAVGKKYGIDQTTMWRYAKIYKLKGVPMRASLSIEWTSDMLRILRLKFHKTFNADLAKQLRVSQRTLIRKARELNLNKEPGFLEINRAEITRRATIALPAASPQQIERITIAGIAHRFKPGEKRNYKIDYSKIWQTRRANEAKAQAALREPY